MSDVCVALQSLAAVAAKMPAPLTWASESERERGNALSRPDQRLRFWAGRWLLRELLHRLRGAPVSLQVDAWGRPMDVGGWALSLSHSADWLAAAVSAHGPVGVDVEAPKPQRNWQALAVHCDFEPCAAPSDFYRQWTLTEAWYKAQPAPQEPYGWKRWRWLESPTGPGWCWTDAAVHVALYGSEIEPQWLLGPALPPAGRWAAVRKMNGKAGVVCTPEGERCP